MNAKLTAPGTKLKLGQTAIVRFDTLLKTGTDDPAFSIGAIEGNNLDGDLSLTGYFPHCPQTDTPNAFAARQSFNTCQIFMEHGKVTQIAYNGSQSTIDSPIIWS